MFNGPAEVQRIGGRDIDRNGIVRIRSAHRPQQIDGFRTRELLPGEARHKASAANFALRFHAPQHRQQLAPGGATVSRASRSRNRTPQRSSNCSANFARPVASRRRRLISLPAPSAPPHAAAGCSPRFRRFAWDRSGPAGSRSRPRSPARLLSVPTAHLPLRSAARFVARTRSAKNDAPRSRVLRELPAPHATGPHVSTRPKAGSISQSASSRTKNEIGAMRVGRTCRSASINAGCGESRRPRHFARQTQVVQILRAVLAPSAALSTPSSHAEAGISKPCNCRTICSTPSAPCKLRTLAPRAASARGTDGTARRSPARSRAAAGRASGDECAPGSAGCTTRFRSPDCKR